MTQNKILIVDDDGMVRLYVEGILRANDFSFSTAASGDEALEILKQESIELVLCDIEMPGLSGIDLLGKIGNKYPSVAVMMMTGIDSPEQAAIAIDKGAYSYLVKPFEPNELLINLKSSLTRRKLELEQKRQNKGLEQRVCEKTNAINTMLKELDTSHALLRSTIDALVAGIAIIDETGKIITSNRIWQDSAWPEALMGAFAPEGSDYLGHLESNNPPQAAIRLSVGIRKLISNKQQDFSCEYRCETTAGPQWFSVHVTQFGSGPSRRFVVAQENVTDKKLLEMQYAQAQKLESVGQLAAGVAHEINTPMQYIGDNLDFLQNKMEKLQPVLDRIDLLANPTEITVEEGNFPVDMKDELRKLKVKSFVQQVSEAITDSRDGVQHVSRIVRAMKEFAHPGQEAKAPVDINRALESTIAVSTNEWKYVAEIETDFDDANPLIPALVGELNQVFLNLLVNAAHAIGEANEGGASGKGTIKITTRHTKDDLVVLVADTGAGIPEVIKQRIFDPFFTTKEIGKGTGQGLAIARSVIVQKHGGTLSCESQPGAGTTFRIQLPLEPCDSQSEDQLEAAIN